MHSLARRTVASTKRGGGGDERRHHPPPSIYSCQLPNPLAPANRQAVVGQLRRTFVFSRRTALLASCASSCRARACSFSASSRTADIGLFSGSPAGVLGFSCWRSRALGPGFSCWRSRVSGLALEPQKPRDSSHPHYISYRNRAPPAPPTQCWPAGGVGQVVS